MHTLFNMLIKQEWPLKSDSNVCVRVSPCSGCALSFQEENFYFHKAISTFQASKEALKAQLNLAPALLFRDCAEINHFCTKPNSCEEFFHCNTFPDKLNNFVLFFYCRAFWPRLKSNDLQKLLSTF